MFTSSTKRKISHFHVVVVQWWQRNVPKIVMHVQSCCFVELNLLLFAVFVAVAVIDELLGSFRNDDGDGSETVKTAIAVLRKTTGLHVHYAFLFIS